ncbi:PSME3-interacting protein isoform X2 [Salmo salar]|uniref:PSME3-interacting protein isoform X2 n=1 Tax=Salmo salar TaxID=8030 RepID=A0A1S3MNS6_SALSA|nr:PSME3-interacting protein isoform X2 [Salmo salar]|eukprot:XP_014004491.1 PREDICTED: protein FAM192A isoform X2 [Salmo salar]
MAVPAAGGVDLSRKFVSETVIEEKRKQIQEEWEKVRKPEDPEEAPEEEYDGRSLFERLQEQKDKKQEEYDEQFKFKLLDIRTAITPPVLEEYLFLTSRTGRIYFSRPIMPSSLSFAEERDGDIGDEENMVKGLDEDESHFLDEVSRQQSLVEKQRRDEEQHELKEYRSALKKLASSESRKEPERRVGPRPAEVKTSHLSQAHLLAGAVKRRSSSQSSDNSKKHKVEESAAWNGGQTEQEAGGDAGEQTSTVKTTGILHRPSAAVCVGILPGLGAYSGSSDSESSSDSEA